MKKILIIGSNFGAKVYLKSAKVLFKKAFIDIVSPNIKKKKINYKYLNKFTNYEKVVNKDYNLVICATKPKIQSDFIKFFFKKKIKKTHLMIEKPLSNNFLEIFKTLKILEKKKILFNINFIFPKIYLWKKFFSISKKKNAKIVEYIWHFKQEYFNNKIKTWKTNQKEGGGILLYYLPHVIFNILNIDKNLKLKKIIFKKKTNSILTEIKFILFSSKNVVLVDININSKNNCHIIKTKNYNKEIQLSNFSKDWTKNFRINNKKYLKLYSQENRVNLTTQNLIQLLKYKKNNNKFKIFEELAKKTYKVLYQLEKKING